MRRINSSRKDAARGAGVIELPTAKDLGFIWAGIVLRQRGGGTSKAGGV